MFAILENVMYNCAVIWEMIVADRESKEASQ